MSADEARPDPTTAGATRAADAIVAVTACTTPEAVIMAADALRVACRESARPWRAVLVHSDTVDPGERGAPRSADETVVLEACHVSAVGRLPLSPAVAADLLQPLSAVCGRTGARACVIIGTAAEGVTPDAMRTLLTPLMNDDIDLVCSTYPRHRFDGLINSGVVYPLTRALYGRRVNGQLGVDFGFSTRLLTAICTAQSTSRGRRPVWPVSEAVARSMSIAQARLDRWCPPAAPAVDAGSALTEVLGSLFADVDHHAATWQRTRGFQAVPTYGDAAHAPDEARTVDVHSMIESFRIGVLNLQEVWARLLPPASIMELQSLARRDQDQFRMSDRLWARVVFDFALGYRLRNISRDHVLGAMTPLYLAWAASFVLELTKLDVRAAGERLEQLCVAYEAEKPYLVARWRWPDRFNP